MQRFNEQAEKARNESGGIKAGKACCALMAIIYTGVMCFFFYDHWKDASTLSMNNDEDASVASNEYVCVTEYEKSTTD